MMRFLVAGEVPEEYVPLLLEELELDGVDAARCLFPPEAPRRRRADFHVVVIGAGMSGARRHPARPGRHPVHDHREEPRGRRHLAREPLPGLPRRRGQPLLLLLVRARRRLDRVLRPSARAAGYFERTARAPRRGRPHPLRDRGGAAIVGRGHGAGGRSPSATAGATGPTGPRRRRARSAPSASSTARSCPTSPADDPSPGVAMHSAQWVDGTDLTGKRVAVIGTGASAFQIVPTIAPDVEHLDRVPALRAVDVPQPALPRRRRATACAWAMRHLPFYGRWYRFLLFWPACDGGLPAMRIDPDYAAPGPSRQRGQRRGAGDVHRLDARAGNGDDPSWRPRSCPTTCAWASAPCRTTAAGWARSCRPERRPGDRADRTHRARRASWRLRRLRPRRRRDRLRDRLLGQPLPLAHGDRRARRAVLAEQWGDEPTALYLGITVPASRTCSASTGPGTNLAHGGSSSSTRRVPDPLRDGLPGSDPARRRPPPRSRSARRRTTPTTSGSRPSSPPWSGRTRRSATAGTATTPGRSSSSRRGGWSTTGRGPAAPTRRTTTFADDRARESPYDAAAAPVAQRIERRFPKPCVAGSSPAGGTNPRGKRPHWNRDETAAIVGATSSGRIVGSGAGITVTDPR
jgi:4-hydroxyacetophenone monooxygenase